MFARQSHSVSLIHLILVSPLKVMHIKHFRVCVTLDFKEDVKEIENVRMRNVKHAVELRMKGFISSVVDFSKFFDRF